jgi:hypothetical protein
LLVEQVWSTNKRRGIQVHPEGFRSNRVIRQVCTEEETEGKLPLKLRFPPYKEQKGVSGRTDPSLPSQENPKIGNLSIFSFLTPNLVSKVLYYSNGSNTLIIKDKNRGKFLFKMVNEGVKLPWGLAPTHSLTIKLMPQSPQEHCLSI